MKGFRAGASHLQSSVPTKKKREFLGSRYRPLSKRTVLVLLSPMTRTPTSGPYDDFGDIPCPWECYFSLTCGLGCHRREELRPRDLLPSTRLPVHSRHSVTNRGKPSVRTVGTNLVPELSTVLVFGRPESGSHRLLLCSQRGREPSGFIRNHNFN